MCGQATGWYEEIPELTWEMSGLYAYKVLFQLWYLPTLTLDATKNRVLKEVAKPYNMVFYYIGHGDTLLGHAYLSINAEEGVEVSEISNAVGQNEYQFVFLNCCLSAKNDHELGKAFNPDACMGWEGKPYSFIAAACGYDFFTYASTRVLTVKQIFDILHVFYNLFGISFWGDGDFKL
ncbi:MAG: hypothetical protein DRN12_06565 [Thermoplasmata archaeon]|nr:MAG: hypothetical protein DRN12_06565 [Thermoplasmata archaeon]